MPSPTLTITNQDLLKSLQQSALLPEEKEEFKEIFDSMTAEEKEELRQLIEEANQAKKEFETERTKELAELNRETAEKLKVTQKEELQYAMDTFETFDQAQTEKEMMQVEASLEDGRKVTMSAQNNTENNPQMHQKSHHLVQKFILILLVLLVLGSAVIYGLYIL